MTGSAARRSTGQKATMRTTAATPMSDDGGRQPPVGVPAQAGEQDQAVAAAASRAVPA